ncbi:hypothetical protein FRB99_004827 [Tulasnella sp. 403]|nr:hypothetical protein FRB99_004827 [Tulasnella sp. 403]
MSVVMIATYYLPLFYQSAQRKTPIAAGIQVLPFMLAPVVGSALSGAIVTRTGYPLPWMIAGPVVASIGSGLLYWQLTSFLHPNLVKLGIFQAILGFGLGSFVQLSLLFVYREFEGQKQFIAQAGALVNALQLFGGMVGVSIAGTIFTNKLRHGIQRYAPGLPQEIMKDVVESVNALDEVPSDKLQGVLFAYSTSLGYVFILGITFSCIGFLAAFLIKNYNIKKKES